MPRISLMMGVFSAGLITATLIATTLTAAEQDDDSAQASLFEDPIEKLVPVQGRSEAEADRVKASALFANGRVLFQRQDYEGALRYYQRAWRYDPQAIVALRQTVPLAFQLRRNQEAARYAVIAAELDPRDPVLLKRLAIHLTEQEDYPRALGMYERALELSGDKIDATTALVHMEMGRLAFLAEDFDRSANSFALVRDALADPEKYGLDEKNKASLLDKPERTYALLGESFFQAGRYKDAVEMFKKANEAKLDEGRLALLHARVEAKQDHVDAALKHLEKHLEAKTSSRGAEAYTLYEELLQKKHGEKKTQELLRDRLAKMYQDDPKDVALVYFFAKHLREAGELDKAATIYDMQLKQQPALDGYQGLVEIYAEQKKLAPLLEVLGSAVSKTGSLEPLADAGEQVWQDKELLGQLIEAAREQTKQPADKWPEGVTLAVALLALSAEQLEVADTFFELSLQPEEPTDEAVLLTWGLELFMADEYERAAKVFQRAVDKKLADENPDFYFYLAGALEMAGETDKALEAAKQAAKLKPDSSQFQSRVPWILYHAGRDDEAEAAYIELIKKMDKDHSSPGVRDSMRSTRMVLSTLCIRQDRFDEAVEWLEQVLDEFPEDIGAMNDLGYLWADEGLHLNRSLAMIRKAVESEPDNIAYLDSLGWVFYRLGRHEEAIAALEKAAAGEDDPDGVILDHLGDAYAEAGNIAKALETWKRAAAALESQQETELLEKTNAKIKQHTPE